jgi:GAF domain-containing protein
MASLTKAELTARLAALEKALAREKTGRSRAEEARNSAREHQAATAEILQVIARSPSDAQPVFEAIVAHAARLCDAEFSAVARFDGEVLHLAAIANMSVSEMAAYRSIFPRPPRRDYVIGRAFLERRTVHVADVTVDPEYDPHTLEVLQRAARYRTYLGIPIVRDGVPIGVIGCGRRRVKPFTPAQIALVKTFADQAAIAIENARSFTDIQTRNGELAMALEQQTATSELLKVIGRSTFDLAPVFATLAENAVRLCAAERAFVFRFDGQALRMVTAHNVSPELQDFIERSPIVPGHQGGAARAALERRTIHIDDAQADPEYSFRAREVDPFRTVLAVPMLHVGELLGVIVIYRHQVVPFTDRQIALMETFADQAAIAIENARLLAELQSKNAELTDALEQQTATSEILRVISQSPTDVQPVFDTIVRSAVQLSGARFGALHRFDGERLHLAAHHNLTPEALQALRAAYPMQPSRTHVSGRAVLDRAVAVIEDVLEDADYARDLAARADWRSLLGVPVLRADGTPVGAIVIQRREPGPFAPGLVELLKTFADQAVIAIENVRLFTELGTRNAELRVALDQQTATSEILRVISSSPTDVQPVFDTIVRSAVVLCDGLFSALFQYDGELIDQVAQYNFTPEALAEVRRLYPAPPGRELGSTRAILERTVVNIADVEADADYRHKGLTRAVGMRSGLYVPMLRDGEPVGVIMVARARPGVFEDDQIELLKTFADQAVIAIQNVRLFTELEARNRELRVALDQQTATAEILRVISRSPTFSRSSTPWPKTRPGCARRTTWRSFGAREISSCSSSIAAPSRSGSRGCSRCRWSPECRTGGRCSRRGRFTCTTCSPRLPSSRRGPPPPANSISTPR